MSTDVTILENYLDRIKAHNGSLSGLSVSELYDMRTVALRVMAAANRAAEEMRKNGMDPNDANGTLLAKTLLEEGITAQSALSKVSRIGLASELSVRGVQLTFKVIKVAVTTGLPLTAAAAVGAAGTYLRMGGTVPFFGNNTSA